MNEVYQKRRALFLEKLGPQCAAVVPGNSKVLRNGSVSYPFRQDSDLLYLTGFPEPDAIAVFTPGQEKSFTLFVNARDAKQEIYYGPRKGVSEAITEYGAHQAFPKENFEAQLLSLLDGYQEVTFSFGQHPHLESLVLKTIAKLREAERKGRRAPYRIADLRETLPEQRLLKDEEALRCLRRANEITKEAHLRAMQIAHGGMTEGSLAALIEFTFGIHEGTPGYESIIAGGNNATILHYHQGKDTLPAGQLLLVDAGCEWQGFSADVTRTFPIRSAPGEQVRFSTSQRKVYEWVLKAQLAGIRMARPGSTLDEIYEACRQTLTEGMVDLGLLSGDPAELMKHGVDRQFSIHLTSHFLGMDVHDVGEYFPQGQRRVLADGMVFTIEPGLYIPIHANVPEEYRGIGIRIEDDILITSAYPEGHEILSEGIPKTVEEIEDFLNRPSQQRSS